MNGSHALIQSLIEEGVTTIFGYPGGTIIPAYDALYDYSDKVTHYLVRHEQAAVHAAEGYARATGRPGVVIVTSGPGATNTVTGIADAMMDSTPLVVISGQVGSNVLGTDAFQEVNFVGITQAITKWNILVKKAEDIPHAVARAFYIARSGRPGPVVIDITKDAQNQLLKNFKYEKITSIRSYKPVPNIEVSMAISAANLINKAKKPIAMIGQGVILAGAEQELRQFLDKTGMPVASTLMGLSAIPTDYPQYVGFLGMHGNYAPTVLNKEYDLVVAIGMRFSDRVTGNPKTFAKNAKIIHLDIDDSEINKVVRADIPLLGDAKESIPLLTSLVKKREHKEWLDKFAGMKKIEHEKVIKKALQPDCSELRMGEAVNIVSEVYNSDAIIVTDVGQQQMAAARYSRFTKSRSLITSGGLGTMGFGLPAAIGASLGVPDREVCLFAGDGGFQMNIQELGTILQYGIKVKIILLNNSFLGMVRQWQELFYERRYSFTALTNPDFSSLAKAYNVGYGMVNDRKNLREEVEKMKAHNGTYILEVKIECEHNIFPMVPAGASLEDVVLKK